MIKKLAKILVTILLVTGLTNCVSGKKKLVNLKALSGMERIGSEHQISGSKIVKLKCAKNEIESFQVVIGAGKENITVLSATLSDLSGPNGTISSKQATLYREEYVRVRLSTPGATLPPGLFADPLVPFINPSTGKSIEARKQFVKEPGAPLTTEGVEMYAVPFTVWKGENQAIWVDVFVPEDTPAGEYKGSFIVQVYDGVKAAVPKNDGVMFPAPDPQISPERIKTYSIPVNLTVWDFALPALTTHRNSFGSFGEAPSRDYGLKASSAEAREVELNYCRAMTEHRITPPIPGWLLPEVNEDGSLKINADRTAELLKFIRDYKVTDLQIPRAPFADVLTKDRAKAIRYYRDYYGYFEQNGLAKRAYLYMEDEPNSKESYEHVLEMGKLVAEAEPRIKRVVVEQTYLQNPEWPAMDKAVDIWCPLFGFIDEATINEKLKQGDEVWTYTALAQGTPLYHPLYSKLKDKRPPYWAIDQALTSYRVPTWINYRYKINGLLYWSTVYSGRALSGTMDSWFLPTFAPSGFHFNGEGYLLYPGVPAGINGPVVSMRLKNIRDSLEDYEYFALLEKLTDSKTVTRIVAEIAPNWWDFKSDPQFILKVREKIAQEIVKNKW